MENYQLCENVNLSILSTDKFKDNVISIRFLLDLDEKKASARSLLAFMLANRTKHHPTNQQLTSYMDDLFGMSVSMNTYSLGAGHLLELRCTALADQYAKASFSLLEKQFGLLHEVLFQPLLDEQGLIDEDLYEEAKMIMESRLLRRKDDPTSYAMEENSKRIGKGTPFAISCLGEEEDLAVVSREKVMEAYVDLIEHSIIDIYVVGSVDQQVVRKQVSEVLNFQPRQSKVQIFYSWPVRQQEEIEEQRDIDQSSLVLTWLTKINLDHPLYYPLKVANGIFGGDANSMLFKVVREQHSLCYSIYSSVYSMDEVMMGVAGISYDKKDQALGLIEEQFIKMKQGDFPDDDMETSKRLLINSLQSQFDAAGGMINFLYQQKVTGLQRSLQDVIDMITAVNRNDVLAAINEVELTGIFVLKEREGASDEDDEQ